MKIRIQGNTLRLRVTQSEVDTFREDGLLEAAIRFRPGERLVYALQASERVSQLRAHYAPGRITVLVPATQVPGWTDTAQVSLEADQRIDGDEVLSILVEKDFQCLHKPPEEKDADAFPNPLAEEDP